MKALMCVSAAVIAVTMSFVQPAAARETCKAAVSAEGRERHGERHAMRSAIRHWQNHARDEYGAGFADWYYSGDRTISCTWDDKGVHYVCKATAKPCGPR